ncbi:GNAT family N-acetyltransferase [Kitasatospora brasiliensis]|uniref:GNAT family N-acetyltransferase n=1 Tax=Kitasatospora brasiliensis TaxID=3058040 RepID=UPI00292F225F|nr:GNAT family N-acetyltransferase [Kitasatospora sp. K002]
MITDHWPLKHLRVTSPRLELRLPTEDELAQVADVAARGVHPPHERPFLTPWGELAPAERARHVMQLHWARLGRWTAEDWVLNLVAFHEGRPVGIQDMRAKAFGVRREILSGSWLGLEHQGKGLGTEMRAAMLHLAFAELGAKFATSHSFTDNHASLAVSRKLGYLDDGIDRDILDGRVVTSQRLRLTPDAWAAHARTPVTVTGLTTPCRPLFGLDT